MPRHISGRCRALYAHGGNGRKRLSRLQIAGMGSRFGRLWRWPHREFPRANLDNEGPAWLANAHRALDEAVFAAYGWPPSLTDDDLPASLLEAKLANSATTEAG